MTCALRRSRGGTTRHVPRASARVCRKSINSIPPTCARPSAMAAAPVAARTPGAAFFILGFGRLLT
jgi:hypothetical protein